MIVRGRRIPSLGISSILLALAAVHAAAQPVPVLSRSTDREGRIPLRTDNDRVILRQRKVEIDLNAVRGPDNRRLRISLFDNMTVEIEKRRQETPRPNTFLWFGEVVEDPGSIVVLAIVGESLSGNIVMRRGHRRVANYHYRSLGNGVHALRRIAQFRLDPEGPPGRPTPPPTPPDADPCTGDSPSTIDVLVAYTDDVLTAHAGDADSVESLIYDAVGLTNESYEKSGIAHRIHLVPHVPKVDYAESRNGKTDRNRLQDPADGHLDDLHGLRDTHAADIVVLVANRIDRVCGMTNVMETPSAGFEAFAFAVVRESCIVDNYSFTHELGHIMGARHDRFSDGLPSTASGSHFGHVEKTPTPPGTPWYTLMATFRQCTEQAPVLDCDRIPYWSNPDLKSPPASGADALGVADREDNSRRLNDTARVVANFRCSEADDNALRMRDTPEGAAPARAAGAVSSRIRSGPP